MAKAKSKARDPANFKQFLGNKSEGQGFADKRKRKAAYEYLKLIKKEKRRDESQGKTPARHKPLPILQKQGWSATKGKKVHSFTAAEKIAKKKQEDRQKRREEAERVKTEKKSALETYKARKKERHLKLCKRTSKGQPVMKNQMEVLLEKIKKQKQGT